MVQEFAIASFEHLLLPVSVIVSALAFCVLDGSNLDESSVIGADVWNPAFWRASHFIIQGPT